MKVIRRKISVDDRKGYLGGSSWAAALGYSKYRSALAVAEEYLTGIKPPVTEEQQAFFDMRHRLEKFVAGLIPELYGLKVASSPYLYISSRDNRLGCHPDRLVVGDPTSAVEIKTSSVYDSGRWGDEDTDQVPYEYLFQCYSYFETMPEVERVYLFRYDGNFELRKYVITRNQQMLDEIVEMLTSTLDEWDEGKLPGPSSYKEAILAFNDFDATAEADENMQKMLSEYAELKAKADEIEKAQDGIKVSILEAMKAKEVNAILDANGKKLCSVSSTTRTSFDSKAFLADHPEYKDSYQKTSVSQSLRINTRKKEG